MVINKKYRDITKYLKENRVLKSYGGANGQKVSSFFKRKKR